MRGGNTLVLNTYTHASMTKLVCLLVAISTPYREKFATKFRDLCKISLNILLTIAKVHFPLKLIFHLYFCVYLKRDKSAII